MDTKIEHTFGGDWTEDKLSRLRAYLVRYRSIFSTNSHARYFTTWYVDAFAGTGSRVKTPAKGLLYEPDADPEAEAAAFFAGSAQIALGLALPFDQYLFIEKSRKRAEELGHTIDGFPQLRSRTQVVTEDANSAIQKWCKQRDWSKERAVVFLDPYGMQVEWQTVQALAATQGVDLWYLFPFATRLLRHDGNLDEAWVARLDKLFGTHEWQERFYRKEQVASLFGDFEEVRRDATVANVQSFTEERLRSCFVEVAPSLILKNSKGSPLYAFCFAASNAKGAPIAVRIAKSILKS